MPSRAKTGGFLGRGWRLTLKKGGKMDLWIWTSKKENVIPWGNRMINT